MPTGARTNRGPSAAKENRAALVEAARAVFDERGMDAPLSAIARRAGVGQGSLYRHFPTRESLALAVFDQNMGQLERLAAQPATTLRDVADLLTHQIEGNAALIDYVMHDHANPALHELEHRLRAAVESTWDAAVAEGTVGPGVTVDQFMFAVSMIAAVVPRAPAGERHDYAAQAWDLLTPWLRGR